MKKRVLIIFPEDDHGGLEEVRDSLNGYELKLSFLEEFFSLCQRKALPRTDLIVLDAGVEAKRGLRLLAHLKESLPSVPVIFISSIKNDELILEVFRKGAREFYLRPVNPSELRRKVDSILRLKEMAGEERTPLQRVCKSPECSFRFNTDNIPYQIMKAVCYMEEHYSDDLNVDQLASVANMSKFHFIKRFKETLGITPMRLITLFRIEKAKELLKNTERSISSVAIEVGFNDVTNFERHFKRLTGTTPSRYKKALNRFNQRPSRI
ncbi:MAG: helix-turn-helix domain-containing protein [Nitrospirae bacterium]|nr:MAG: helix-turn-helix domain-containing protein [Nitrospirota bacterium]